MDLAAHYDALRKAALPRWMRATAHSTVIRFRRPLANPARLVAALARCQRQFIGTFEVAGVELVFNDWYQRARHTQRLATYALGSQAPG